MIATLTARERRLVAVGLLLALIVLAWLLVIAPIAAGFTDRADQRDALTLRYALDERAIGQLPSLRRAAERQRRDRDRFAILAADPAAAVERLKERLSASVIAAGGEVRVVEDLPRAGAVVRARLDARLDPRQLATVLTRLSADAPLLTIDTLNVATDNQAVVTRAGPMNVHLETSAASAPQRR